MRIKETKVFTFAELSEDVKDKAIEKLYDLNVDHDWWDSVYDDAKNIGLKITEFDIDRGAYARGNFIGSAKETAEKIIANHGPDCETVATSKSYLRELQDLDGHDKEINREFLQSLLEDYRIMLSKEYDYLTSREAIIETIESNEYEFDEHGNLA